jgi:hypothetical protein
MANGAPTGPIKRSCAFRPDPLIGYLSALSTVHTVEAGKGTRTDEIPGERKQ